MLCESRAQVKLVHFVREFFVSLPISVTHFNFFKERAAEEPVDDRARVAKLPEEIRIVSKGVLKL